MSVVVPRGTITASGAGANVHIYTSTSHTGTGKNVLAGSTTGDQYLTSIAYYGLTSSANAPFSPVFQLWTGDSGSEVLLLTGLFNMKYETINTVMTGNIPLGIPVKIAAGTRLSFSTLSSLPVSVFGVCYTPATSLT